MNILVLNSGSSSLKYRLINMNGKKLIAKGICEKIGEPESIIKQQVAGRDIACKKIADIKNHTKAFENIVAMLLNKEFGAISDIKEIAAVGHRVVHGGKYFKKPALISSEVIEEIKSLIPLAPLHNPAHLAGILGCRALFGESIPQVAVFDTSFYCDLPDKAYMYPIPYEYYKKYNIRKYGFHGTSHRYVSQRYGAISGKNIKNLKIISCHLGNGSSITAIKNGKAVDTSMGLTPLGGIMMGTRSGTLDPSVILHIAEKESFNTHDINNMLNKRSGLFGVSGIGSDERELIKAERNGNERAALAHRMMVYQIMQYIGSYTAVMKGLDAVIFTGGIGENVWIHRKRICDELEFMGIKIDDSLNQNITEGKEGKVSTPESAVDVFVIPTNEELEIARETEELVSES